MGRRETVTALGEIGDPAAIPALSDRLTGDQYVTVRASAAEALANLARASSTASSTVGKVLGTALTREREPVVQAAVREALAKIRAIPPSSPRPSANRTRSRRPAQPR
jgi:HEAT repeat protein